MYRIKILPRADKDIRSYQKAGNKSALTKIRIIIKQLEIHPTTGAGKPEQLKCELAGYWSRRIDKMIRIIYRIEEERVTVVVVSAVGHYL
jgi:toxin YoeB